MKQPLQYIILLETIIKEAENEYQHSCREAATKADAIRKLAAWTCYDDNPGGVSILSRILAFTF